jgi:hypothetical protein
VLDPGLDLTTMISQAPGRDCAKIIAAKCRRNNGLRQALQATVAPQGWRHDRKLFKKFSMRSCACLESKCMACPYIAKTLRANHDQQKFVL